MQQWPVNKMERQVASAELPESNMFLTRCRQDLTQAWAGLGLAGHTYVCYNVSMLYKHVCL